MRPLLLTVTAAALVAVAACNGTPASNNTSSAPPPSSQNGNASGATDIAHTRHENFEQIGDAFKAINTQLKGSSPDMAVVRQNATVISGFAPQVRGWFPLGSGPDVYPRSRAKAEIWRDTTGFARAADTFAQTATAFEQAAQGDAAAAQAALPPLSNSCRDCHERFRGPERD